MIRRGFGMPCAGKRGITHELNLANGIAMTGAVESVQPVMP